MKRILAALTALSLALVTLITATPVQANGIVVTPSTLAPSHGQSMTVQISGLDPAKSYELFLAIGHNQKLGSQFLGSAQFELAQFTPSGAGTHTWTGNFVPDWSENVADLDAPLDEASTFIYMDAVWGLFPMRFGVAESGADPAESFADFAGVSAQLYPSSQNGIGTLNYSGAGYVDGSFVAGQEVTLTGSGWGDIGKIAIIGAAAVPKVDGETASETFWRGYIEDAVFNDFFQFSAIDGEVDTTFNVPTLPSGDFVLWVYYFAFDDSIMEGSEQQLSLNQHRAAYQMGYSFEPITATSADAPVFTDETLALSATVGTAYSDSVAASGTGVTYSIDEGALPGGLSLNSSTGAITGTPTVAGEFDFTIKATNADGSDLAEFTIVVSAAPVPPVFTDETLALSATVGTAYSDSVAASGSGVTYSIDEGALPSGLSLNSSTGAITGTPSDAGEYTFTIRAQNGDGSDYAEFTIVVSAAPVPPVFTDETLASSAMVGLAYSDSVAASGTGVTYSIDEGALPGGLSLNSSTGAITGTPTAAGEFDFTIRAQNGDGSDYAEFTIVVSPDEVIDIGQSVSRHDFVVLDEYPQWYSVNKDICHVAQGNIVVFANIGPCIVRARESGTPNAERKFNVGQVDQSDNGRVNGFDVYFAKGSSALSTKAMDKLSTRAAKFKNESVVVYGYSAGKNSPFKADRLANLRAKAVAAFLEGKGVSVTMVRGVGSTFQNKKKSWKNKRALIQISRFLR
jgi:outer membrane protein OmpA-like peptidoglycan-associated protein